MFCNKCGNQVADNEQFCPNCGAPVGAPQNNTSGFKFDPSSFSIPTDLFGRLVMGGSALLAIGTLLPIYTASAMGISQGVSFISGDGFFIHGTSGIFVLILAIAAIVLSAMKKDKFDKFAVAPVAVATLLLIFATSGVAKVTSAVSMTASYGVGAGAGFGLYLMWIGAIAALVGSITPLVKKK